jgi:hypothetical protein
MSIKAFSDGGVFKLSLMEDRALTGGGVFKLSLIVEYLSFK